MTDEPPQAGRHRLDSASFQRIAEAIAFLRARHREQPGLGDLAAHLGLSESHTQRLFTRWAGVSPKRFLQFLTVEYVKGRMDQTADLLGLAVDAGLSGPGRLHDLFVNMEAMSPGEFKRAAAGLEIRYGQGPTPFGDALLAFTGRGICHLSFLDADTTPVALEALLQHWPAARFTHDPVGARERLSQVFGRQDTGRSGALSLWVSGSNFQIQVWRALLAVPPGGLLNYRQLAALAGRPGAARAVGTVMARNPVAYLIPCHRVLRGSGDFGMYHWGEIRKQAICGWEAAQAPVRRR
jgi:AraC family transcriptional regulator of adaptative response/methylated-DNA-[protein]-cysteine methyltransferase